MTPTHAHIESEKWPSAHSILPVPYQFLDCSIANRNLQKAKASLRSHATIQVEFAASK